MQAISVKELRQKFPFVRSELAKGESFLIIHKSKPIAELRPTGNGNGNGSIKIENEATDEMLEAAAIEDMNKALGDDCLTEEEVKYYLSLNNNGVR